MAAAELARRAKKQFVLEDFLFDKQLAFVRDPSRYKTAVCSRRSGKSVSCAADLVDTALKCPNSVLLYITLSRNTAKKIVWKEIKGINRIYKLDAKVNETDLSMTFPNGAMIYCSGAKDATEIEKFRGLAIKKAYIDECQSFRSYIRELIDEVLAPALMDYAGTLCLIGTPGPVPAGYFYECSTAKSVWSHHAWTYFDNPFIVSKSGKSHRELMDVELARKGVAPNDPSVQREWFGKWVMDSDSLLLHYNPDINHYDALPIAHYDHIMGIDLGFIDADAIAVVAWSDNDPCVYLVDECVMAKQGISELVDQIKALDKKYKVTNMLIDEGGLGKKIAEEMRRRFGVPVIGAEKQRKMENIEFLNDAMRRGHFKASKHSRFAQDSYLIEIDRDKSTPDRIKVKDNFHSDIVDAVLYAFKKSPAFSWSPPPELHKPGTPAWFIKEEDDMEEQALEAALAREDIANNSNYWDDY